MKARISSSIGLAAAFLTCLGLFSSSAVAAYPDRPIRIVTNEPGGGNDFVLRLIQPQLSELLGQRIVIDNRSTGNIAIDIVAKSVPDGYTLLFFGSALWLAPLLQASAHWNVLKDFAPITLAVTTPNVLVVPQSGPRSVKELIAVAKSRPGQLNFGSGSTGSSNHLAAELFKQMAGVEIVRVNYKGAGPALTALISGEVQLMFATAGSATAHIKSGKLRPLAVTTSHPSALFPQLPTVASSGLPGYESGSPFGAFAPARTPDPVLVRLNREMVRVLGEPEIKEKLLAAGVEPVGSSRQEVAAAIKSEMTKWAKVINTAGIKEGR